MSDCRQIFVCEPNACSCTPDPLTITIRNANLNAKARAEADSFARTFLILLTIGMAAFCTCFAGAALVDKAGDNWSNVNLAYQELRP